MRARSLVAAATVLIGFGVAHADPKADVEKKIKEAMESYDGMDYDAARKQLNQALTAAKKGKLDKDPVAARAYLDLGIVSFVNGDADAAKLSFVSAVQIDPKIQIDPAYKSPEMAKLLDQARSEAGGGAGPAEPAGGGDCGEVKGLQHAVIDTSKANAALPIEAQVGADVKFVKVSVMVRPEGATDFTEIKMSKQGGCKFTATIPAAALKGSTAQYYVAAYNEVGKPIASKGSSGSPNIIELTANTGGGAVGGGDNEDPINGKAKPASGGGGGGGEISSSVTVSGPKRQRVFIAMAGGTGFGYLSSSYTTEANNPVKSAGFGNSMVVLQPELGYMITPQVSAGVVLRLGLPIGANVDGHATAAPGALVRVRYAMAPSGEGVHFMGQVGAGILRNTLKLDKAMGGMDTDIVAQGPLLLGGGVGYTKSLSGNVSFLADLSALAAIAVVDHFGSAPKLNSGVGADLSVGIAVGF